MLTKPLFSVMLEKLTVSLPDKEHPITGLPVSLSSLTAPALPPSKITFASPIFSFGELRPESFFVDPIPQALTLTSIVIGACTTAMSLALVIKIREMYGTTDTTQIRRLRG